VLDGLVDEADRHVGQPDKELRHAA
jgi:hypothetical protein